MGIRQTVASALATPMIRALDGVLQKSVEDMIAARAPAGRSEVDAARRALDDVKRDLIARRTDLAALQQALAVAEHGLDEDLDALFEEGTPDEPDRTVRLVQAAVDELSSRVEALSDRAAHAAARADQAGQIATTARATAESLADALDER